MAVFRKQKFNDLGLDTKTPSDGYRSLNKDGTFNVKKLNVPLFERINFFHSLVSMSWWRFFGIIAGCYILVNLLFASFYMAIGVEHLTGIDGITDFDKFLEAFFFSAQTITTLGYGRVAPIGIPANIVAAVESMLGLLSFALATGLMYGRFSKPSARILYSAHAVIAPYQEINGFMFRVVNPQNTQLLEVEINVTLSMKRENSELRNFYLLELERPKVVFFPSTWTIVHPITEGSPLYRLTENEVLEKDAEFIVMIRAFDESFSQTVYSRSSYMATELKWGEKFIYLIQRDKDGISVDVGRIDETEKAALNP
ncbi:MAG: ion channel [Maribacter sp.]|nr:ion channel [Maribacter sp.]